MRSVWSVALRTELVLWSRYGQRRGRTSDRSMGLWKRILVLKRKYKEFYGFPCGLRYKAEYTGVVKSFPMLVC